MEIRTRALSESVAVAQQCLAAAVAFAAAGDLLGLHLPPLGEPGSGILPSPQALRAMAALYLQAELEQAGLIVAAEWLVAERNTIGVLTVVAAEKMEKFRRQSEDWYDPVSRAEIFARVFGIGPKASASGANRGFQQFFAGVCSALLKYEQDYNFGQNPGPAQESMLRVAAEALLTNLGPRQHGNTVVAARTIHDQLSAAIVLLEDPGVSGLFGGRGLWDTMRKLFGDQAPDLGRILRRAQTGQRLLVFLSNQPALWRPLDVPLQIPKGSQAFRDAAVWLEASGFALPGRGWEFSA